MQGTIPLKSAHLCQTRQINQRQVKHIRAVYPEVNGQLADTLVLPSDSERLLLDLFPYLVELRKAFVNVQELAPFGVCLRAA